MEGGIDLNFFPPSKGAWSRKLRRLATKGVASCASLLPPVAPTLTVGTSGVLLDVKVLEKALRANVPDYTFQEAYDRTGKIINIVIAPQQGNLESARLLNYLTAPNVVREDRRPPQHQSGPG